MDPGADDAEDTDELFVRPVVRIPAPLPAEAAASNFEISGKRQRSQVPPPPPPPRRIAQRLSSARRVAACRWDPPWPGRQRCERSAQCDDSALG